MRERASKLKRLFGSARKRYAPHPLMPPVYWQKKLLVIEFEAIYREGFAAGAKAQLAEYENVFAYTPEYISLRLVTPPEEQP